MQLEIDLMGYKELTTWKPKIGDMLFKDGILSRWCAVVEGINNNNISVRISGNPRLLVTGDYKSKVLKVPKIVSSMVGAYFVVDKDGIYYV